MLRTLPLKTKQKKQKHPPPQTALRSVYYNTSTMKSTWCGASHETCTVPAGWPDSSRGVDIPAWLQMKRWPSCPAGPAAQPGQRVWQDWHPQRRKKKRVSICIHGSSRSRHLQVWNPHPGMTVTGQLGSMLFIILYFRLEHIFVTSIVFLYFTTPQ